MLPQAPPLRNWMASGVLAGSGKDQTDFHSILHGANGFSQAPQMDPALIKYLSQQMNQVRSGNNSDSDYTRFSKSSGCSGATGSAVNGASPSGISPTSSLAGPLLDCHILGSANAASPTSTTYNPMARVSDRTSLSCVSPTALAQLNADDGAIGSDQAPGDGAATCPTSIVVTSTTDAMHAAGLINFSLTQPGVTSFVLIAQLGSPTTPGSQATLCAALRVAIAARRIHLSTALPTDLAIMPVFSTMPASKVDPNGSDGVMVDCINLHVYHVAAGLTPAPGTTQQLRMDLTSHPMLMALQLAQGVLGATPQGDASPRAVEVTFGAAAARSALHTLTHAHAHLASAGHEALLLPSQGEGGASTSHFSMFVVPAALAPQQQAHAATRAALEAQATHQAMQHLLAAAQNGPHMPNFYTNSDPTGMLQPNFARMSNDSMSSGVNPYHMLAGMGLGGAPNHMAAPNWQYGLHNNFQLPFNGLGMDVLEGTAAGAAAAVAASAAAAAQHRAQQHQQQQQQLQQSNGGSTSQVRLRARKADWVIVTEDTAIKNAAGAVAKVLGRMALQGLCCPVFMERKTARYTGVVSVAVKAIAVARGYVHNEGSGHEVGFQPYIRGDASACAFGAARPPGAPSVSAAEAARSEQLSGQLSSQLLSSLASGDLLALELLQASCMGGSPLGLSPRTSSAQPSLRGGSPPLRGSSPPPRGASPPLMGGSPRAWGDVQRVADVNGGSGSSSVCGDDEASAQWADLEQAELAFDVYKVMLQQEVPEGNNLPVKVTAHSRPGVVSSIISKLILERQSAVLITAGGRAMHVAMLAVVAARQRLQSQGVDILLLPKFVTVDTTQTLGWESVFLKFSIIKWSPAAALAADMTSKLNLSRPSLP